MGESAPPTPPSPSSQPALPNANMHLQLEQRGSVFCDGGTPQATPPLSPLLTGTSADEGKINFELEESRRRRSRSRSRTRRSLAQVESEQNNAPEGEATETAPTTTETPPAPTPSAPQEEHGGAWSTIAPTGYVTFCFSDVMQGDTLWGIHSLSMCAAVDAYSQTARTLLSAHNGYECCMQGTILLAAFTNAVDAVNFASALHIQCLSLMEDGDPLLTHPLTSPITASGQGDKWGTRGASHIFRGLRLCIGLSVGKVTNELHDSVVHYKGKALTAAAMLCCAAGGGQTLVSQAVYKEIACFLFPQDDCPLDGEAAVVHIGWTAFKDPHLKGEPIQLFQVLPGALRERAFPVSDLAARKIRPSILAIIKGRGPTDEGEVDAITAYKAKVALLNLEITAMSSNEMAWNTKKKAFEQDIKDLQTANTVLANEVKVLQEEKLRLKDNVSLRELDLFGFAQTKATLEVVMNENKPIGDEMPSTSDDENVVVVSGLSPSISLLYKHILKTQHPGAVEIRAEWNHLRRHEPTACVVAHMRFANAKSATAAVREFVQSRFSQYLGTGQNPNVTYRGRSAQAVEAELPPAPTPTPPPPPLATSPPASPTLPAQKKTGALKRTLMLSLYKGGQQTPSPPPESASPKPRVGLVAQTMKGIIDQRMTQTQNNEMVVILNDYVVLTNGLLALGSSMVTQMRKEKRKAEKAMLRDRGYGSDGSDCSDDESAAKPQLNFEDEMAKVEARIASWSSVTTDIVTSTKHMWARSLWNPPAKAMVSSAQSIASFLRLFLATLCPKQNVAANTADRHQRVVLRVAAKFLAFRENAGLKEEMAPGRRGVKVAHESVQASQQSRECGSQTENMTHFSMKKQERQSTPRKDAATPKLRTGNVSSQRRAERGGGGQEERQQSLRITMPSVPSTAGAARGHITTLPASSSAHTMAVGFLPEKPPAPRTAHTARHESASMQELRKTQGKDREAYYRDLPPLEEER